MFLQARNNKLQQQMMPRDIARFLALNMYLTIIPVNPMSIASFILTLNNDSSSQL